MHGSHSHRHDHSEASHAGHAHKGHVHGAAAHTNNERRMGLAALITGLFMFAEVAGGIAAGSLAPGHQLPTVRQLAVDLSINPNTVVRAYRELEIRGVLQTQQGTGTFVSQLRIKPDEIERRRVLNQLVTEFVARAGAAGFTIEELLEQINDRYSDSQRKA
jgi:GntR family transcriptional regulator